MGDASPSLFEYVPDTSACKMCRLPDDLRAEILEARSQDERRFTFVKIAEWLTKVKGHSMSEASVRRHFRNHA